MGTDETRLRRGARAAGRRGPAILQKVTKGTKVRRTDTDGTDEHGFEQQRNEGAGARPLWRTAKVGMADGVWVAQSEHR